MFSLRPYAAGLLALTLLAGCRSKPQQPVPAPQFELKDLNGHTVSLASLKGYPILLDFWATWCGPCRLSIPLVQHFYETNKDKGLMVLGVNIDEDASGVYSFVKEFGMTYPVAYGGGTSVPDAYGVDSIPMFIFIDKQGRITRRYHGFRLDMINDWEDEFQRLSSQTN